MRNQGNPIFIFGFLFAVLILHSRPTRSQLQEVENQREFDYLVGSAKGPEHWGDLHKEWAACKNGDLQSPIDLLDERVELVPDLGILKRQYNPSNAILKNRGHDISLQWAEGGAGSIVINDTDYVLQQCHWHSPSEHAINGKRFDLEIHLVHNSSNLGMPNRIAVIGIMYNIGTPDTFLSQFEQQIRSIADSDEEVNVGVVNPSQIEMSGSEYYRYMGSLTTPPCTEGVIWTINREVRTVSRGQVELLRMAVQDYAESNARPLQPLNDREIYFYGKKV